MLIAAIRAEAGKTSTISKCANPDCFARFDDRTGRFFRFHRPHAPSETPANDHSVWHFWLCQRCSELYTLESRGPGVRICLRLSPSSGGNVSKQAEKSREMKSVGNAPVSFCGA